MMAKRVVTWPWPQSAPVDEVYSISGCISPFFTDYIPYWRHNGYWLFDSPQALRRLADEQDIDLSDTTLFYYEAYPLQCGEDGSNWQRFTAEPSFTTDVSIPTTKSLQGYDVVTFSTGNAPECSPLSCNVMAETLPVNRHCLFDDFEQAKALLEQGVFKDAEPGPYRLIAVYRIEEPPINEQP
jgi:hypothetical protein